MDTSTFAVEAEVEASHWWFVVRRRMLSNVIADQQIPSSARVLDIGTSTGTNLRLLREFGFSDRVRLDQSDEAICWSAEKGFGSVRMGHLNRLLTWIFAIDIATAKFIHSPLGVSTGRNYPNRLKA